MKKVIQSFVLTVLCLTQKESVAYDNVRAHPALNAAMVNFAEGIIGDRLPEGVTLRFSTDHNQYTGTAVTAAGKTYVFPFNFKEGEMSQNALEWIKHGGFSADEPELQAAVRHFYDPVGLIGGKKWLTNRATYWEGAYSIPMNPETDAIEWALGDTPKGEANRYTLVKAKESLVDALELADETMKKSNLAKAFRSIGEVLHNTGDMGCPPHTRNDSHAAPLGFSGGFLLGAPDPYEELFNPDWALLYMNNTPDPELRSFFENATTIRSIDEKLATFTNENFFSNKTINGSGVNRVQPINKEDTYYSPNLQDQELEYNPSDYIYYKTFPSGNRIKMCTDKHGILFNSRGYPYIDAACVQTQAQELVPDLLCAGAHIIRLFIPKLKVEIAEAKTDGSVTGTVTHTKTAEYNETIYYNGKIIIYNALNDKAIDTVYCSTGDFSGTISYPDQGDQIYASLEIGGIAYSSEPYRIQKTVFSYNKISIHLTAKILTNIDGQYFWGIEIDNYDDSGIEALYSPLIWSGNKFSVTHEYEEVPQEWLPWRKWSYQIKGELASDGSKIVTLDASSVVGNRSMSSDWSTDSTFISMKNMDISNRLVASLYFGSQGETLKNQIQSINYERYDSSSETLWKSTGIDWNSADVIPKIEIFIYTE